MLKYQGLLVISAAIPQLYLTISSFTRRYFDAIAFKL